MEHTCGGNFCIKIIIFIIIKIIEIYAFVHVEVEAHFERLCNNAEPEKFLRDQFEIFPIKS